jgi:hypothetical protein
MLDTSIERSVMLPFSDFGLERAFRTATRLRRYYRTAEA